MPDIWIMRKYYKYEIQLHIFIYSSPMHVHKPTDRRAVTIAATRCVALGGKKKKDWGTLVPRINVENGIKLGFLLE
jgi:hypothetical protein